MPEDEPLPDDPHEIILLAKERLLIPSVMLMTVSIILFGLTLLTAAVSQAPKIIPTLIFLSVDLMLFVGSLNMLGLRNAKFCRVCSLFAVIPCCTFFIGIPVGLWCLMRLREPLVTRGFRLVEEQEDGP